MGGEFEEMVLYHAVLIKIMLVVFVVGMLIPFFSRDCTKSIRRTRIYMFVSHGTITMVGFAGLVAFVFAKMPMSWDIMAMIVAFFAMIAIEVIKYRKVLKIGTKEGCLARARGVTLLYGLVNLLMVAGFVIYKVMDANHAVPLS